MPERPLLLFSTPRTADRTKKQPFIDNLHRPSHNRQQGRLDPRFQKLQEEFEARQAEIRRTASGIEPEQVLVLETVGDIQDFINAVKKIKGFEWMAEIDIDEITPDEDFYDEKGKDKLLRGRLYLIMSNHSALKQMLSLWEKYKNNKDVNFNTGLAKFNKFFASLKDIRLWGIKDRLEETGVIDAWKEDLQYKKKIRFEIEFWFRNSGRKREDARNHLEELVNNLGGVILDYCLIEDIAYHAMLAEVPADQIQQIIDHPATELVKYDEIMFFHPAGQIIVGKQIEEENLSDYEVTDTAAPTGDPIVAILDGLPLENHELIAPWMNIDDPDNYAAKYPANERQHGTAMASLIVRGDLNDNEPGLSHPVYVRPIMKLVKWRNDSMLEKVPDDILPVDYIHRAVRRIFEGEGDKGPEAPSIKIINFSIGDPCRQFVWMMSPLAKLLDWLSTKYKVLFIISAGNHDRDIKTDVLKDNFKKFSAEEKENKIVETLYADARHRRLLSPGESINGITVGGLHHDASEIEFMGPFMENLFGKKLPSPISPFGSGYRKSIKPDLLFNGGRVLYAPSYKSDPDMLLELRDTISAPGNKVASPGKQSGELKKAIYSRGTSNAAALTTRMAAMCHDVLQEVLKEQEVEYGIDDELRRSCMTPLIKSMVVHGCSWGETGANLQDIIKTLKKTKTKQEIKKQVMRWLGYGVPEYERVLACTAQRVTLLGYGELSDGEAHVFNLPMPPSLDMHGAERKLTVTLAWISPIAPSAQRYRTTQLWFEVDKNRDKGDKIFESGSVQVDNYASQRGTVQHQIFESKKVVDMTDKNILIQVNCRKDAAKIQEPVPYGLAVTFEIAEGSNIDIYEEIRTQIIPTVEIDPTQNT